MRLLLFVLFCLCSPSLLLAKGKKQPPLSITFHLEVSDSQSKQLTIPANTPLGKKYIQRSPILSTKDFRAYYPFGSPHENRKYGVILQLNKTAAQRLRHLSSQHKGRYLVANINGVVVDMLYIDQEVDGRLITIWRNIDSSVLSIANPLLPRIGETDKAWKQRLKQERRRRKKQKKN